MKIKNAISALATSAFLLVGNTVSAIEAPWRIWIDNSSPNVTITATADSEYGSWIIDPGDVYEGVNEGWFEGVMDVSQSPPALESHTLWPITATYYVELKNPITEIVNRYLRITLTSENRDLDQAYEQVVRIDYSSQTPASWPSTSLVVTETLGGWTSIYDGIESSFSEPPQWWPKVYSTPQPALDINVRLPDTGSTFAMTSLGLMLLGMSGFKLRRFTK